MKDGATQDADSSQSATSGGANAPHGTTGAPLGTQYRPREHETHVWDRWIAENAFRANPDAVLDGSRSPYAILIPPPNVTAALHLGHALNNTIQDVLIRAHRMMGYETLWMPGTDHAGIATQTVVDRRLKAEGQPALADYKAKELAGENGRDEFVAHVQAFKDEYEERITGQLKSMGCSCDYGRQRFTMDELCSRAVREAFFRLFKDGLIYRGKRLVNWDPVSQTALADDEVEMVEVDGGFYYLRYPLVHPSDAGDHRPVTWGELAARGYPGAENHPGDDGAWVTVATTRPETYLGDTGVAVNPHDPRAKPLDGLLVELPLVGRRIPIVHDDYVVLPVALGGDENDPKAQMATGFLKVTPAHDPNDWEIGQRHDLKAINVMAPDASISPDHGWDDYDPRSGAHVFVGLSREDARKKVIAEFKARHVGDSDEPLLEDVKPYRHSVGHSYRSHAAVEPYLSDQWYVKVTDDRLRGEAQRSLGTDQRTDGSMDAWPESKPSSTDTGDGSMTFYPARYAKTFETWHDNLRDWCISRQLWWGHRIPVWHQVKPDSDELVSDDEWVLWVAEQAEAGRLHIFTRQGESMDHYKATGKPLTARFICFRDAPNERDLQMLERRGYSQDPDVLDTWFSSALWPMSTMGWPDPASAPGLDANTDESTARLLSAFNPSSVLTTAREIITLWVSRMAMFNRYLLGDATLGNDGTSGVPPFKDVFIHAMIQDGDGRKMSKSLGNGVDPLDIIATHGADAMRFTLVQMTTQTQDVRMPVEPDPETGKNTSPKFDLGRNFCNKLWNAARFAMSILDRAEGELPASVSPAELSLVDRWMLSRLAAGVDACEAALKEYQFAAYADALYDLLRRDFCDWYLEAIKPTVDDSPAQRVVLRQVLDAILRVLHPAIPFITESIYEHLSARPSGSIEGLTLDPPADGFATLCRAGWPVVDGSLRDDRAVAEFDTLRALVEQVREVRSQHQVPPKRRVTLHVTPQIATAAAAAPGLFELLEVKCTLTTDAPADGAPAVAFRFESTELSLSDLADAVDAGAERSRLEKHIADLDKSIAALEKRLSNPGYVDKAPAHLVDQTRGELERAVAERDAARAALEALPA